jgi:hypothetical protein
MKLGHWRLGIARFGWHLELGVDRGALVWAPYSVQAAIIAVWNWAVCGLGKHAPVGPYIEEGRYFPRSCIACDKVLR